MSLTAHERYLRGERLTPLEPQTDMQQSTAPEPPRSAPQQDNIERALSRGERVRLAELRASEGWPVLTRLLERAMQIHRRSAITMSTVDPLGHTREITEQWAYVAMMERAVMELKGQVEAEIRELQPQEARQ